MRPIPEQQVFGDNLRLVLLGVNEKVEDVSRLLFLYFRYDVGRSGGSEVRIQHGGGDANSLLPAGLTVRVESGAIKETREDVGNFPAEDSWPVVGDCNAQAVLALLRYLGCYLREEAGILAGIERVMQENWTAAAEELLGIQELRSRRRVNAGT